MRSVNYYIWFRSSPHWNKHGTQKIMYIDKIKCCHTNPFHSLFMFTFRVIDSFDVYVINSYSIVCAWFLPVVYRNIGFEKMFPHMHTCTWFAFGSRTFVAINSFQICKSILFESFATILAQVLSALAKIKKRIIFQCFSTTLQSVSFQFGCSW